MIRKTIALVLLMPLLLVAKKFLNDDPLEKEPTPLHIEDAKYRKLNDWYDFFENTFFHKEEEAKKGKKREFIGAQAVNTLGEVPDSAWFTNRIGSRPMTTEEIVRGPGNDLPPSMDGDWTVVGAKASGVTPGFSIRDSKGNMYLVKFDPLTNPEMATGADVIGSKLFYALGYHTPENYVVTFHPDRLVVGEDVALTDMTGQERPMKRKDLITMLLKVPDTKNGQFRAVASRFIGGKFLGEFRYYDTRDDDYNDVVPHEHRRDLRGLHVFCAWMNHNDSRAINNMDVLAEEDDLKFVKHYLIDFGSMLGSASVVSNTARDGNAYFWEAKPAMLQIVTLGAYVPRWARDSYLKYPSLGMIEYKSFEPEEWRPNYPNPAFDNRLVDDEFWAAKKVMAFTDWDIYQVVKQAKYSDSYAEDWMTAYLILRRNKIGEVFFAKLLPLDNFKVEKGKLEFEDLQIKYGFVANRDYQVQWSTFDNDAETHSPISGATSFSLANEVTSGSDGSYFAAKIQGDDEAKTVTVYLHKKAGKFKVVGIDRTW